MKPDWKNAPEWANWLAMDSDGSWYWFAEEPDQDSYSWRSTGSRYDLANPDFYWKNTKEQRCTD